MRVEIELGERSYPVLIGPGMLGSLGRQMAELGLGRRVMVGTNPVVERHYGALVREHLEQAGVEVTFATIPTGERAKRVSTIEGLCEAAIEAGLDRKSTILALGGGVVGDAVGFAAAVLYRGVRLVQVPTTLMAMVDSSVGGKTAVNSRLGKNLIGAFWQPALVCADLDTLRTLPPRELRCGLAEVVKHGCILDAALFERLETELADGGQGDWRLHRSTRLATELLSHSVQRSCELKGAVVAADEREQGQRAWLNFGHTFGHAVEVVCGYGQLHHGEAVAVGMVLATRLGVRRGELDESVLTRLVALLEAIGLPTRWPAGTDANAVYRAMYRDKKVQDGRLRLTLLESLGQAKVCDDTPSDAIEKLLDDAGREADDGA